jgi:hypothetical protein
VNVELLVSPGCPNASAARAALAECQHRLGLTIQVWERVGDYPSPTVLVNGIDVMTNIEGTPRIQACRLDVPTAEKVLAALRGGSAVPTSKGAA